MESDLHRFAYKLTSDRDSANDLVQDCVLQALDNHEKFTHAKNLKGWMFTIMRNIFVNNYRRTVREMNLIDDTYSINQQSLIEDEEGDRFEFAYDMKQLYRVIHSIPEDMKVPFQMFVAGFKYREIAEKLGLPMGTVKSRLFFIRKRLKEELKDFSWCNFLIEWCVLNLAMRQVPNGYLPKYKGWFDVCNYQTQRKTV